MNRFSNGHHFRKAIRVEYVFRRDGRFCSPLAMVEMSEAFSGRRPQLVSGTVDTGAFRTMLTFKTAEQLGFDPKKSPMAKEPARVANGQEIRYYVHPVFITIPIPSAAPISFFVEAAFSDEVTENLFGIDWLEHLCLTVDTDAIHFCKD